MDSVPLKKAKEEVEKINKDLLATDTRFRNFVRVIEKDGTEYDVANAFLETHGKDWVVVFSEHHPVYIVHRDELVVASEMAIIKTIDGN